MSDTLQKREHAMPYHPENCPWTPEMWQTLGKTRETVEATAEVVLRMENKIEALTMLVSNQSPMGASKRDAVAAGGLAGAVIIGLVEAVKAWLVK